MKPAREAASRIDDPRGAAACLHPVLTTLVYCVQDDQVLLLRRNKAPFAGFWVAPGGKIRHDETPAGCAARELKEETGLSAEAIQLRGIVREVSPTSAWQWLIFIYLVTATSGSVVDACPEGELRWWDVARASEQLMPAADRIFYPAIVSRRTELYEALFEYEAPERLIAATEYARDGTARPVAW